MVTTIHQLEVQFDVEGEGDEAVFTRLFEKHIRRWSQAYEDEQCRRKLSERERALGDQQREGD